jgi:hypothetical protein
MLTNSKQQSKRFRHNYNLLVKYLARPELYKEDTAKRALIIETSQITDYWEMQPVTSGGSSRTALERIIGHCRLLIGDYWKGLLETMEAQWS